MKRSFKYIAVVLMLVLVLAFLCSCGQRGVTRPAPAEGAKMQDIEGSVKLAKKDDSTLRVICAANLKEGTVLSVTLDTFDGEQLAKQVFSMPDSEAFYADFEIKDEWQGPITAALCVTPAQDGKQPSEIAELYGSKLENMQGDAVLYNVKGNFVCIQSEQLTDY